MIDSKPIHISTNDPLSFLFMANIPLYIYIYVPHLLYPFIYQWTTIQYLEAATFPDIWSSAKPAMEKSPSHQIFLLLQTSDFLFAPSMHPYCLRGLSD